MIKGNVTIELHNHKTGLRDRIEGENSITSAFQDMINRIVASGNSVPNPIIQKLLGGIIITDSVLSDDISVPYDAQIIGSGYYNGTNVDSTIVGSYNGLESGYSEANLSFTQVYDFSTSQANGTIRSVCLTNQECGQHPLAYNVSSINPAISLDYEQKRILYVDDEDLYYVALSNGEVFKVTGYNSKTIRINDSLSNIPNGVSTGKFVTVPTDIVMYYDGFDGYVYHFSYSSGALYVSRIKVSDYSFTEELNYKNFVVDMTPLPNYIAADINNGYIYVIEDEYGSPLTLRKIDYDSGDITEIGLGTLFPYVLYGIFVQDNGSLYIQGRYDNTYTIGARLSGNSVEYDATTGTSATSEWELCGYEKGVVRVTPHYLLGSIQLLMSNYNLQEAITKTSNQSMKVTYTLRMV